MMRRGRLAGGLAAACLLASAVYGHPLAPSLLELRERDAGKIAVRWKQPLAKPSGDEFAEPVLPSECEEVGAPEESSDGLSLTRRWVVDCGARGIAGAVLRVRGLGTGAAAIRIELRDGRRYLSTVTADAPDFSVPEWQGAFAAVLDHLRLGLSHIASGADHLLFVAALFLSSPSWPAAAIAVTGFTFGHAVTLTLAVLGWVWIPAAMAEIGIAATLLWMAVRLVGSRGAGASRRTAWWAAASIGLVHGVGFASGMNAAGVPSADLPLALLGFNAGIELGQLVALLAAATISLAAASLPERFVWATRRVAGEALGIAAAYWCIERTAALLLF